MALRVDVGITAAVGAIVGVRVAVGAAVGVRVAVGAVVGVRVLVAVAAPGGRGGRCVRWGRCREWLP